MNTGNLFGTLGLVACIGGLLVLFLVFVVFRALTGRNRSNMQSGAPYGVPKEQERPTYDDPDIQSSGGFGGEVPPTGRQGRSGGFGFGPDQDTPDTPDRSSTGDRLQDWQRNRDRPARQDNEDDDDIRSSGGFGKGS